MFAKRLAETIDKRKLSRYKIAQDTKITEATLSNYCNGKGKPSPSIVKQLADYLEVNYNWLLTGDGDSDILTSGNKISDSTSTYRARKKPYSKNDMNSMREFFEDQLKTKDSIITNYCASLSAQLTSMENKLDAMEKKLDLLNKGTTLGKK